MIHIIEPVDLTLKDHPVLNKFVLATSAITVAKPTKIAGSSSRSMPSVVPAEGRL
ncbi:hypothetical protein ACJJH9_11250 [Microbulbifer sp. DLAB2-AF]|uniref:hypothetical protein n=1 Tax=Microbulbifer sp. DLAB2-AF TaxID=3243395 RepID=UPI00403A3946